ncbi:hypothetical protein PHLCEN_2v9930 [Hermanssonia centrifuga]|uniref:CBS domain-containing protein n=1 Tax=Hermanssonia centrifuga TaxID=98765 RepID=A0A2R6NPB7_9APHY|nr:hypothetical protein PHLCEN_2v9930 [Hermanssonia centrifuga]
MISVMVSKWVGDALGKDGIYAVWIAMRQYPWLPPGEYRDQGQTAAQIMKPVENVVVISDEQGMTLQELGAYLEEYGYHGYPVVRGEMLIGFVVRDKVRAYIETLVAKETAENALRRCTFSQDIAAANPDMVNLSSLLEEAVLQLRKEVPLQLVVNMFQKMNLRHVLFSQGGKLTGLVTKTDIVWLLTAHLPHTAALSGSSR